MPHIIMECSANLAQKLDKHAILKDVHDCLSGFETVAPELLKTRMIIVEDFICHEGTDAYIAATVKLLEGRSIALRQDMSKAIKDKLVAWMPDDISVQPTVEIVEMTTDTHSM